MNNHHHYDDVERVQQPNVDHFDVRSLGHHLVDGGLNGGHHHHGSYSDHYPVLGNESKLNKQKVESQPAWKLETLK